MKKSELIALLRSDTEYTVEQTLEIEKLLEEFPFFNTAQIILSVAYHQQENLKFEKQLRKAAAYANDRKKLHDLHFDQAESKVAETSLDPAVSKEEENIEAKEVITAAETIEAPSPETTTIDKPINTQEEKKQTEADEFLEEQLISAAISSSILLEVDEESRKLEEQETTSKPDLEAREENKEEDDFVESENHSFSDWLTHYSDEPKEKPIWESASPEAKKGLQAFDQTPQRSKQEFYSAAKMARLSVQEDDDLVTETLAKVYAQQGNYDKAIKAFQKLELKYPEKKIYFAGQIQRLKDELNS